MAVIGIPASLDKHELHTRAVLSKCPTSPRGLTSASGHGLYVANESYKKRAFEAPKIVRLLPSKINY